MYTYIPTYGSYPYMAHADTRVSAGLMNWSPETAVIARSVCDSQCDSRPLTRGSHKVVAKQIVYVRHSPNCDSER